MIKKLLKFVILTGIFSHVVHAATSPAPKAGAARSNYPRNAHHVVGGGGFAIELRNGELWAWGANSFGQLGIGSNTQQETPVREASNATNWSDINPGKSHVLAVKADGTLWAWGLNNFGQLGLGDTINRNIPHKIGFDNDWVTTGCSGNQSFAIKSNGTLWAWGNNSFGQLGKGNNSNSSANWVPVQIGSATNWTDIAAGSNFTVGLNASGQLFTWGNDAFGQLGNATAPAVNVPTQIQPGSSWTTIEAGADFAMAIRADGMLFSWGRNNTGQLGIGNNFNQGSPAMVSSALPWIGISCGQDGFTNNNQHALGLKSDGTAWSWGDNFYGELGNLQATSNTNAPGIINPSINNIIAVECGWGISYIRDVTGQVYACGSDSTGAMCNTQSQTNSNSFITISVTPIGWSCFSAGENFTVALKSNGTLWFWGSNNNGQAGNGSTNTTPATTAVQIGTNSNWKTVSAGSNHILAINAAGELFVWGSNSSGQIGNNSIGGNVTTPFQIASAMPWIGISGGNEFSLAVQADGSIWSWGANSSGQLGKGNNSNLPSNKIPVQIGNESNWVNVNAGYASSSALKADGTLWMWGENSNGQLGKGNNTNGTINFSPDQVSGGNWICIGHSSGAKHVVAIKANGSIWSWGNNSSGALGKGNNNVSSADFSPAQIGTSQTWSICVVGANHSAAIKSNGIAYTWGDNTYGQLGLGYFGNTPTSYSPTQVININNQDTLDVVIDINCGWNHTGVIKEMREKICLTGQNLTGQIGDGTFGTPNNRNEFQCVSYAPPCTVPDIPNLLKFPNNNVCPGTNTILSINSGNLNSAQEWRWYADNCGGTYLGSGNTITVNPTLTKTYFVRGEGGACFSPGACASIMVNVNPTVTPTISIATSSNITCNGANLLFYSTVTNGGSSPSYQWKINGSNAGTNSPNFVTNSLTNGQTVSCVLTSNEICTTSNTANSNNITVVVNNCTGIPTTQLRTADCGAINLALNAAILCTAVAGASNYDFEFTNVATNAVGIKTTSSNSVSLSSVSPAIQFGSQYYVRVRAKVGGIYGNFGNICLISTVCNPSICGVPLTKLRTSDCGKVNFSPLTGQVIADAVAAASQYEFEFRNISTNALYATKLQTSNVLALSSVTPAMQWNTQYNVKVRAYIAGVAGTYGTNCVIGFIPDPSIVGVPNTQLSNASCGKTNLALTGSITCIAVTGAGSYEWEFKDQSNTTVVATKTTTGTSLTLNTVTGLQWNTQYNLRVRAYIGAVAGTFNVSCLIGIIPDPAISGVPSTKIRTSDCGKLNFGLGGFAVADVVSGAAEYEFEIRNATTNAFIANKIQASNVLTFSTVPAFTWNTQYKISVRARISSTWGTFGTACTIGFICDPSICGVPNTALRTTDCGKLNLNFSTGFVAATTVNGATLYEFEITDISTSTIVSTQARTTVNLYFNTITPALISTKQYSIRVRATISGVVGAYGSACIIGFASGSRENMEGVINSDELQNENSFNLSVYPNPFNNHATLFIQSVMNDKVNIEIYDMMGNLVWEEQINPNQQVIIGGEFASGTYLIKAMSKENSYQLSKIIKYE